MISMLQHFPKCPMCASTIGYEFTGLLGTRYAKCYSCKAKWKLSIKKGKIKEMTLHELPMDGSAVYTIRIESTTDGIRTNPPVFSVIGIKLDLDFWLNLKLDKKINWDFLSKDVNSEVSEAIFKEVKDNFLR